MVETVEAATPLCRDFVPELLRVVAAGGEEGGLSLNVVESLELLLDAGAFKDAHALASGVVKMLGDDRRNRLFQAYVELCLLMQGAPYQKTLERIEVLATEISGGGFSANDQAWSVIVLSRAVLVGVYTRALPEGELLRARALLSEEFSKGGKESSPQTHLKVGLELVRSYLQCSSPELPAARELLERLRSLSQGVGIAGEVVFDIRRLQHQVGGDEVCPVDELRGIAAPLGVVARGLAEVTVARRESRLSEGSVGALERALALFEESAFRSGEFEVLITLATAAAESEHHTKAHRLFCRADKIASENGFLFGRGIALLGMFHSLAASGEVEQAKITAERLVLWCSKDIFLSAFGLNTVAALQLLGRFDVAVKIATRSEKLFASQGAHALTAQAAFMTGASHASTSRWKLARSAWKRALTCDELRRAPISACERRAALAQAIAMTDFTEFGELRDSTRLEVRHLLLKSEKVLSDFGDSTEALSALGNSLHVHAQLSILSKEPLEALRYLNRSRETYATLGLEREVALSDGLTGLALLEASKTSGSPLVDEAMASLQRALDFFSKLGQLRITWKIRYYLAVACVLRSQQSGEPGHRESYRQMAISFLEDASKETLLFEVEPGMPRSTSGEGDFSPGLKPEVLEPMKEVLGIQTRRRKGKGAAKGSLKTAGSYGPYLH